MHSDLSDETSRSTPTQSDHGHDEWRTFAGLPAYLAPDETSRILENLLWREFELARMAFGWTPAIPSFEQKYQAAQFGYWHMLHVQTLAGRIRELPGAFKDKSGPPTSIREGFVRISLAPSVPAFWTGYRFLVDRLFADYDALLESLDPVTNSPTVDALRRVFIERHLVLEYLSGVALSVHQPDAAADAHRGPDLDWLRYCEAVEIVMRDDAAEPSWPDVPAGEVAGPVPEFGVSDPRMKTSPSFSSLTPEQRRDYNFYVDEKNSPLTDTTRQMIYINATEIAAAERVVYLFYSSDGMPLEFYQDTARHMWDEFRHSMMGLRRLQQLGFDLGEFSFWGPVAVPAETTAKQHYDFYEELTLSAETCSFGYKRACAEAFRRHGDIISAVQSEFDVADERLHTGFGAKWSPILNEKVTGQMKTNATLVQEFRQQKLRDRGLSEEQIAAVQRSASAFCSSTSKLVDRMQEVATSTY